MIDISDRLCIEHGLSVSKNPHKAASRPVWFDEKQVRILFITYIDGISLMQSITQRV